MSELKIILYSSQKSQRIISRRVSLSIRIVVGGKTCFCKTSTERVQARVVVDGTKVFVWCSDKKEKELIYIAYHYFTRTPIKRKWSITGSTKA